MSVSALTIVVALILDLPLRDPDGIAGPAFVRLPAIMLILLALDVVPRGIRRRAEAGGVRAGIRLVIRERWPRRRLALVLVGLLSFYLTYVAYRNLKSFLPFVREGTWDVDLLVMERTLFGEQPGEVLHRLLGTGISAHLLSTVYVFFLLFVPISLGAALVWSRDTERGFFYVTALCINWVLGAASYYVLPSLGPAFAEPRWFSDLPSTGVSELQATLLRERIEFLADPWATSAVQGIAGFASLHVAIVFSAALVAHLVGLPRLVRWSLWAFLILTIIATIYFGWHYVIDDVAGLAIGAVAVWIGALATGRGLRSGGRRVPAVTPANVSQAG